MDDRHVYINPEVKEETSSKLLAELAETAGMGVKFEALPEEAPIKGEEAVRNGLALKLQQEHRNLVLAYRHAHNRKSKRKALKDLQRFRKKLQKATLSLCVLQKLCYGGSNAT